MKNYVPMFITGASCSDIRGKSRKLAEALNVPYRFCSRAEGGLINGQP